MSAQNLELVRAIQPSGVDVSAATDAGELTLGIDVEALASAFDPDFETSFIATQSSGLATASYRGPQGLIDGWRDWLEPWASYRIDAEEFIDAGERVVVLVRVQARTRRGGVEMQHAPAAIYQFREGRIVSIEFHLEREQALAAAGLSPR